MTAVQGGNATALLPAPDSAAVQQIKFVAYSLVAYLVVGVGMVGNLLSLVVLTRPNLKGVMYVYLLGLAVSNLCVLITAIPALYDISEGFSSHNYATAFYQAHLKLPLINSCMASSVYIIIFMTINRYISIYRPTHFQRLHTAKNARIHISLSFLAGTLLHVPLCFQSSVVDGPVGFTAVENRRVSGGLLFKLYLVSSEILLRQPGHIILHIAATHATCNMGQTLKTMFL